MLESVDASQLLSAIAARAWLAEDVALPETVRRVPTMLTREEQRMLLWLARHRPHADAAVCDLGSFLGGSTVALAQGIRDSGKPADLHAFDMFTIDQPRKEKFLYSRGDLPFAGNSMLHIVQEHVAPFADFVVLHPGDVTRQTWEGGPISILFVDISKSWPTNDVVVSQFFPSLRPGSVVIQQDFFFPRNPWLHATMHKLRGKIVYAGATERNSAIFYVRETPAAGDLQACLRRNTPNQDVFDAIAAVQEQFHDDPVHLPILRKLEQTYARAPDTVHDWQFR